MARAFVTDAMRTVRGTLRRWLSIAAICLLGTTMLVGLTIACEDLRLSADAFFDTQRLYDVSVQSTLGLTDDDVSALAALDGVEAAEGSWGETAQTQVGGASHSVAVHALTRTGMNEPRVLEGRLPERAGEVAVTDEYLEETGSHLGDTVTFATADADAELFSDGPYTIVARVIDPMSVAAKNGSSSFRATGARYTFFVAPEAATSDAYSVVYLRVSGTSALSGFSEAYQERVAQVTAEAEDIKQEREQARERELTDEATAKVDEAEAEAHDQLADGEEQLAEAQAQIDDALAQIAAGRDELAAQGAMAAAQLDAAQATLDDSAAQLAQARSTLDANEARLTQAEAQLPGGQDALDQARAQLEEGAREAERRIEREVAAGWSESDERAQLVARRAELESQAAKLQEALDQARAQAQPQIDELEGRRDELAGQRRRLQAQADETARQIRELEAVANPSPEQLSRLEELRAQANTQKDGLASLDASIAEVEEALAAAQAPLDELEGKLGAVRDGMTQLDRGLAEGDAKAAEQLAAAKGELERSLAPKRAQLDEWQRGLDALTSGRAQIAQGRDKLAEGADQLESGRRELEAARATAEAQLAEGADQLDDAEREARGGQAELDDRREDFERQKAEALAKIADARAKIGDIGQATWYVQDRSAISSYASIDSDASSIQAIGTVFPAIFLTVAVLVSLTCATRMVEEDRGLIGLYKALGYRRGTIMAKYVGYAASAAAAGSALGAVLGFVALPEFLFSVFRAMYTLPSFDLHFDAALCALAMGMFVGGIGVATALSVRGELAEQPAALMRPKAPRAGTRILLERVRPLWRRLSFLNKVTARNIFRYKRRLAMTLFGVAGCCALMICGFAISDTVLALSPNQYGDATRTGVYEYDLLVVTKPQDLEAAAGRLASSDEVSGFVPVRTENVTLEHGGAKETVQLVAVPNGSSLDGSIDLRTSDGSHLELGQATAGPDGTAGTADDGALVTRNASTVLGFGVGDELAVQDSALRLAHVRTDAVVDNYLGNAVYLTQDAYERAFGTPLEANALLVHLTGDADAQIAFADGLAGDPTLLSVTSIQKGVRDFTANFALITYVVALITTLAAGLSFVVLFTLSTTNVSERERELATIKVLGFRRREVRTYVNKELLLLAAAGTALGVPVGTLLAHGLTYVLNMPSMYFAVEIHPLSYVWSCGLSMLFALVVCAFTNRELDRIDMVGALKSAE